MNETLRTESGRTVPRMERRLAHSPEKVWRALTDPAELAHWFPAEVELELRVGAPIQFSYPEGAGADLGGVVTELDPPRAFGFSWNTDLLYWEIRPEPGGCVLILTHAFDDRAGAASFTAGWSECLDRLADRLDGRAEPVPSRWADRHEEFVEKFGLAVGTAEQTEDGWRVRFERQLIRPVDEIWATLTTGGVPAVGAAAPPSFGAGQIGKTGQTGRTGRDKQPGPVTAVDPPKLLEYDALAGRVRWQLSDGPGGARLVLTQTGIETAQDRDTALAGWKTRVEALARQLRPPAG